jgi:uncharacterized protein with gpF-like domain
MCQQCAGVEHRSHLLSKESDAEREARETFIEEFALVLSAFESDLLEALQDGRLRLAAREAARRTVARIFESHRERLTTAFNTLWEDTASASRSVTARRYDLDIDETLGDQVRRELQEYAADAADETGERITRDLADALRDAYQAGLSRDEMADILETDVFPDMRGWEAERAAQTAATGGAGRGSVSAIRDAGAPGKRWLAGELPRTRLSHHETDGQVVPVGAKFTTGKGNKAWWPGDPRLPPSDFINCRCAVAPAWDL